VALSALGALIAGCGGGGEEGPAPIRVGAVFDLTGPTSDVGTTYAEGIRGYVDWVNENGGIGGRPVELLYQDYAYKVDQAEQLYSQFAQQGVVAFQGWGTGDTEALRGRIAEDKIPFMSASYSHVLGDPAQAPYNFLAGASYTAQLQILLDHLKAQDPDGVSAVALMHNASPFGLSPFEQGGKDYAAGLGIELSKHEMSRGATDFTAELTRIAEAGIRHVVFQNTSGPVAIALRNAQSLGLDLDFHCLNWCTNEVLVDLAGEAAEGVVGAVLFAPPGDGVSGLADAADYLRTQGSSIEGKGLLYGQGWITMHLMAEGIRRAASDEDGQGAVTGERIKAALETLTDFDTGGVTPPITFSASDHWGEEGMRLFQVQGGVWQPLTDLLIATR
jgi:branched-chain amino acid transport system substrate-binding protein